MHGAITILSVSSTGTGGRHCMPCVVWVRMRTGITIIMIACKARSVVASVHASFMTECFITCEDNDEFAQYYSAVSIALKLSSPA